MGSFLEAELAIPPSATLAIPTGAAASLSCGGSVITVSAETSLRTATAAAAASPPPRCLFVGRQASVADVRIDHKSISRRHAAIYYESVDGEGDGEGDGVGSILMVGGVSDAVGVDLIMVVRDLGGKHGTHVNGRRVEKGCSARLRGGDEVTFGNVQDRRFRVSIPDSWGRERTGGRELGGGGEGAEVSHGEDRDEIRGRAEDEKPDSAGERGSGSSGTDTGAESFDPGAGLDGRARREAEIAAMMASLEEAPTYKKYLAPAEEVGDCDGNDDAGLTSARRQRLEAGGKAAPGTGPGAEAGDGGGPRADRPLDRVPATHSVALDSSATSPADVTSDAYRTGGGRIISSISVDPAGSRLVSGCTDGVLRMYDFGGMDVSHKSFREVEAEEGHPVVDVCHSNTGDRMAVATASAQPKIFDREGREIVQFIKGDPYVTDMARTVGHTAAVTSISWHPLESHLVLTSSLDGSARLWDLNGKTQFKKLVCHRVYRAKNSRGQRTAVTTAVFHPGGRQMALGTVDGSVQIWDCAAKGVRNRPEGAVFDAHGMGRAVTSLVYNVDGTRVASRCAADDTVKVWDTKRLSKSTEPITVCADLPALYEASSCAFSPDGTMLCAGTSVPPPKKGQKIKGEKGGTLKFYRLPGKGCPPLKEPLTHFAEVESAAPGASAVTVVWHTKLNQIFVGCSDGK